MSTFVNIELYDGWRNLDDEMLWRKEVMLFHIAANPFWKLGTQLEEMLLQVKRDLCSDHEWYGWISHTVGALLIKYAMEDRRLQSAWSINPAPFEPCLDLHHSSVYVWRIFLNANSDAYDIQCYRINRVEDVIRSLEPVDWRAEAKAAQQL